MQYLIYLSFGVLILSCGSFKSLSDEISVDVNLPANEEISNSFLSNEPMISSFESNNVKKLNLQQQNKLVVVPRSTIFFLYWGPFWAENKMVEIGLTS